MDEIPPWVSSLGKDAVGVVREIEQFWQLRDQLGQRPTSRLEPVVEVPLGAPAVLSGISVECATKCEPETRSPRQAKAA